MENSFTVGDQVLASRAEDGTGHEEAKVVDAYTLLIGEESRPMVVVEFPDGARAYLRADGENVLPLPGEEEEQGPAAG
jgi:hypothetical protein